MQDFPNPDSCELAVTKRPDSDFDSMCERYEARIEKLCAELGSCSHSLLQAEKEIVCLKHGGHEFETTNDRNMGSISRKECKHCGLVKQ